MWIDEVAEINKERGATYDHPAKDFSKVFIMSQVLRDVKDPLVKHVLYMIMVKISRLTTTPNHEDSWKDIIGYVNTADMIFQLRKEQITEEEIG